MAQASTLCSRCKTPVFKPRINVNTAELYTKLRSEFGTAVFNPQDVQEMLVLSDRDLDDYESEVDRLQSRIVYVEAQKQRLLDYKKKLRSLLSPTRRLPNEILGCIFEFTCDQNLLQEHPWVDKKNVPPTEVASSLLPHLPALAISAVCTPWRSLALSSPSLWTGLALEIALSDTITTSSGLMSTLNFYLDRSNDCPLYIDLDIKGQVQSTESVCLTFLTRQAQRWRSFRYREYLNVAGDSQHLDLFWDAPKLRVLRANTWKIKSKLPWNQLISVDITAPRRTCILALCPNLVTVKLHHRRTINGPCPHSVLDKVRSLTLFPRHSIGAKDFLVAVFISHTLPSLIELRIHSNFDDLTVWPKQTFSDFISRSSCSITSLSINLTSISDLDVITILQLLPSLLDLSLDDFTATFITSHLISSLHSSGASGSPPILPKLRDISLKVGDETFDDAAFVSMVSSRWLPEADYADIVGVSCLRSVFLFFWYRKVDEDVYKPLHYMDKMGMRVVVSSQDYVSDEDESDED